MASTNKTYIQPQATELEEVVLGAILFQPGVLGDIVGILTPECFYIPSNQVIYKNILQLYDIGEPIDLMTLQENLKKRKVLDKVGGREYLMKLIDNAGSTAHLEKHARIIQEKFIARRYIKAFTEASKKLYEQSEDMTEVLDGVEKTAMDIHYMMNKRQEMGMLEVVKRTIDVIEGASSHKGSLTGVPSGHPNIDRLTGGWQKTDLVFIASRPGMGKTSFALHSIFMAAQNFKTSIGMFSLEMSATQLGQKMISMVTGINTQNMRLGRIGQDEWVLINTKGGDLAELPIVIDDSASLDIVDIKSKARNWVRKYDVKMIVIDYLQLIRTRSKYNNKNEMIEYVSSNLKALAKELNMPVVCLSQLSREVEKRGNKRPQLSDLRDSGAIEQDADIVIFLYRPDYYDKEATDESGKSLAGVTEIIFSKHRNGALETFYKEFKKETSRFIPIEEESTTKEASLPYKDNDTELPF